MQRRRARELGPPPVPRFLSEPEPEPEATDHEDLGFAATSAWDAPASDGGSESLAPAGETPPGHADGLAAEARPEALDAPVEAAPDAGVAPEPPPARWTESVPDHNGSAADGLAETDRTAAREPEPRDPASWDDFDDDVGPPAPFFVPAPVAGAADAPSATPARAEPVHLEAESEEPDSRPAVGTTLPFWSVPSEPEPSGRRWSLPALRRPTLRRPTLRRPRLRRPTRAGLIRALPVVLLVVGGLLLVEGALTVLWKEPFSALLASRTQNALGNDLEALERQNAAAAAEAARSKEAATRYQRRRAVALNRDTGVGSATGRLKVPKIDLSTVVVQGTDEASLTKGPGHYTQTPLPGQKGKWTVGIAGHRTTYDAPFRRINELKRGDEIVYTLPYGRFTYEVEGTKIVDDSETGVFVPKGYNRIALTACHPLYSDAQRIIAYGKLKKSDPLGGARRAARS